MYYSLRNMRIVFIMFQCNCSIGTPSTLLNNSNISFFIYPLLRRGSAMLTWLAWIHYVIQTSLKFVCFLLLLGPKCYSSHIPPYPASFSLLKFFKTSWTSQPCFSVSSHRGSFLQCSFILSHMFLSMKQHLLNLPDESTFFFAKKLIAFIPPWPINQSIVAMVPNLYL